LRKEDEPIFKALMPAQLMGLCIEREAGGEPRAGKIGVGTIILERVDHRDWDGKTIHEVILKRWQFSWTMPEPDKRAKTYYEESVNIAKHFDDMVAYSSRRSLLECYEIAKGLLSGEIQRDPEIAAAHCCEYVAADYRKFMDAHPEKKCNRWWQKMKLLKTVGNHEFYVLK